MANETVFIVDDDVAVRHALKFMLRDAGFKVEIFESGRSFLQSYDPMRRGCLLLDYQMPSITGLQLQRELNLRGWSIPVILITAHATIQLAMDAVRAGAFDMIAKPLREDQLLDRLRRAFDKNDAESDEFLLRAQIETRAASLTAREREVLARLAVGKPSKLIARELGISFRTVEGHRAHIAHKLQARSLADLIRFASIICPVRQT
jgi:two-component system response regulator FixJ